MVNGNKIKELMKEKGMKSKEVAQKVGISEPMMSYILGGLRDPNVITLARMARLLEVSADDLIVWED